MWVSLDKITKYTEVNMNRIKELRARNNESQAQLAAAVNVSASALSGYETEKYQADIPTYFAIAKHFGVSLDYLLGGEEPQLQKPVSIYPEVTGRYSQLSEIDRAKVIAYMDGILSGSEYQPLKKSV